MKYLYVDCETLNLDPKSRLHCIVGTDLQTGTVHTWINGVNLKSFDEDTRDVEVWVGHNIIPFDYHVLKHHVKPSINSDDMVDTLIMAQLDDPRRKNDLASLGLLVNEKKGEFTEFEKYTPEMLEYCKQDNKVGVKVYKYLLKRLGDWSGDALDLEHQLQCILEVQKKNGIPVNYRKLDTLYQNMILRKASFDGVISVAFPDKITRKIFVPKVNRPDLNYKKGVPIEKITTAPFKMNSPKQVVERLNEYGWRPYIKTKGHTDLLKEVRDGLPVDCVVKKKLATFKEYGWKTCPENLATVPATAPKEASYISEYMMLSSRIGLIRGYKESITEVDEPYFIRGTTRGLGANTHRSSHNSPNMANIPSIKSPYGKECRELFEAREGNVFVGCDASSIQLRILAHLMDDPEFTHEVEEGDVHTRNMIALGTLCKDRDVAKTFIYAWILGAGDDKIAQILGCTRYQAREAKARFLDNTPKLRWLREVWVPQQSNRGYMIGLDGRRMRVDNPHFVLPTALQGNEKIIMATANIRWQLLAWDHGLDYKQCAFVHDEWLTEVDIKDADTLRRVQEGSITHAGIKLGVNCKLKGKGKIGKTWYDVH